MEKGLLAKTSPYVSELEPGTYYWCACGKSSKQPYCDGSHGDSTLQPIEEIIKEKREVIWCGCKQSSTSPFCDGTHRKF